MGFLVIEEVSLPTFGLNLAGCYVTIKGSYFHGKKADGTYYLSANWSLYSGQGATLTSLKSGSVTVDISDPAADHFVTLYSAIKVQEFAGKTFTDT